MAKYDKERGKKKAEELIKVAADGVFKYAAKNGVQLSKDEVEAFSRRLIDNFVNLTPPEKRTTFLGLFTIRRGKLGGGESVKPGNLLLDMRKLFTKTASSVLTVTGAIALPWAIPLAALVVWDAFWSTLKVEVSEREAAVLWTMWLKRDDDNCVSNQGLLAEVNQELARDGRTPITAKDLTVTLNNLHRLGTIEPAKSKANTWWLREQANVVFT